MLISTIAGVLLNIVGLSVLVHAVYYEMAGELMAWNAAPMLVILVMVMLLPSHLSFDLTDINRMMKQRFWYIAYAAPLILLLAVF